MSNQSEVTYELILDEQGIAKLNTQRIIGELRAIIFKIPERDSLSEFMISIDLADYDINIFKEEIFKDTYYPLKVQARDGFNQFFTMQADHYLLNDFLIITAQGAPFSSIICTLRWC